MRRLVRIQWRAVWLVASAVVCACVMSLAQGSTTSGGPYRIAGVLVNAATGEPVRRGVVQALDLTGHAVASSKTDGDGRFELDHLGAAKYQLTASKRGFRTASYDEHDEFATSIVTGPEQDTTHLEYKLTQDAVLHGVVTSDDGEPVANANVMVFKRPKHRGVGQSIERLNGIATDDTGAYEINDLGSGEYMVAVTAEPWYALHGGGTGKRNAALDVVYPVTYFDSTTDEQAATPIELTGGIRQEANIILHAVPALHISVPAPLRADGSMVMPQLQRMAFGNVIDAESGGDFYGGMEGRTLEMGGIAPGHYEITEGDPPHILDIDLTANQQINAEAGSETSSVNGHVRIVSSAAMPGELTLSLNRLDGGGGQSQYATEVHNSRFGFPPMPPGEYGVSATAGDKLMAVVSVGAGGRQKAGNVITLREHEPELLVILSGTAETRIEGFAKKDGKGFAGAMLVLLPRSTAQWRMLTRRDQSDSDGSFAFRDVAPGEYTAIAIEDGWPLDWTSPAVMERYLHEGTNVTVSGNSGKVLRLSSSIKVQQR